MALALETFTVKTHNNLYSDICSYNNLFFAYLKARKGKTKKDYVIEFEKNLSDNLNSLRTELLLHSYEPKPLKTFILRDPKTRKISKSNFRDRVIHHALCSVIEPIFQKTFIYDSCANIKGKGNLFALKRFDKFKRKVTKNGSGIKNRFNDGNFVKGYCLKADIKHYFQEVNHEVLLKILKRKIRDSKVMWLIKKILGNSPSGKGKAKKSMPLGNLTSQFFANVYLNELDYFVKHKLKIKYYIRYVDDFIILHKDKNILEKWKEEINNFLKINLKLELHPDKSRVIPLSKGVDFVGFRNFYYFRLLRKRNTKKLKQKINQKITKTKLFEIYQGWQAYSRWADSYNLRKEMLNFIHKTIHNQPP